MLFHNQYVLVFLCSNFVLFTDFNLDIFILEEFQFPCSSCIIYLQVLSPPHLHKLHLDQKNCYSTEAKFHLITHNLNFFT